MLSTNDRTYSLICVDSSQIILNLYFTLLSRRGYDLRLCHDGLEALTLFHERSADLIITELQLPSMDGFQLCEHLRRQPDTYDIPIVMIAKQKDEASLQRAFSVGVDDYLIKPIHNHELVAKIENILRRRCASRYGELDLPNGSLFAGRYQIEEEIGRGGHSVVYAARDVIRDPNRVIVVKVFDLLYYRKRGNDHLSLFLREAFEHSRLQHENIIEFIDFGQSRGKYFLVMEYLHGLSLQEMVTERGPLEEDNLLFIGYEMSRVLCYLDKRGVIHRDIKPGNIMITDDANVKLLDFGLAKKMSDSTLSLRDEFLGTPHFVSPEHIRGAKDLDSRADVYSLGVTLYWAASGGFPIRGNSPMDILDKQLHEAPPPLVETRSDISGELSDTINRMLAKTRRERLTPVETRNAFQNLLFRKESRPAG